MGGDCWFSVPVFEASYGSFSHSAAWSVMLTELAGQRPSAGTAVLVLLLLHIELHQMRMGFVFGRILICFSTTFFHLFIFSTDIKYLEHKMTNLPLQPLCFEAIWESLKVFATYSPVSFTKGSYVSILLLPSNCLFTTEPPL